MGPSEALRQQQQQQYQGSRYSSSQQLHYPEKFSRGPEGLSQGMGHPTPASEGGEHVRESFPPPLSFSGGDNSGGDARGPYDPNLTCTQCGERFRMGEIQNYKRHVSSHAQQQQRMTN